MAAGNTTYKVYINLYKVAGIINLSKFVKTCQQEAYFVCCCTGGYTAVEQNEPLSPPPHPILYDSCLEVSLLILLTIPG